MKNKLEKYSVPILYIATILGLGLSFFGSIINSKLLSKEFFGDWKYVQNYLMMVSYFVNFGFYYSGGRLIAATDDTKRISTLKGYMLYQCLASLVIMFIITICIGTFWQKLLDANLFHLLLVMFPLFIVQPLMFYLEAIFQAERKLLSLSIYKVLPPLLYLFSLLLFQSYSTNNIYYNAILFYITYLIVFVYFIYSDKLIFKGKSKELSELLVENKEYGSHLYYVSLFNVGSTYILQIHIGYFNINNIEVGNYSLASSFIIPFAFLPTIVGTSYFKQFIKLDKIPTDAVRKVLMASILLLVFTVLSIDYLIAIFLGPKFLEVGFLVKIGAIGAILQGFGDFINKFLSAKGKSPYIKKVAIIVGIIQVIVSLFFIKLFSSSGAIFAKNIGSFLYFFFLLLYYYRNYVKKVTI